jgi:hypothetical protein
MLVRFWRASVSYRVLSTLALWLQGSWSLCLLATALERLLAWGQWSLPGRVLRRDLSGEGLLAGSQVVKCGYALAERLERVGQRFGELLMRALPSSRLVGAVQRGTESFYAAGGRFLAGAALGLGLGTVVFGLALGGLTPKRLWAAVSLFPLAGLLLLLPDEIDAWLEGSLCVRWVRWFLRLGSI